MTMAMAIATPSTTHIPGPAITPSISTHSPGSNHCLCKAAEACHVQKLAAQPAAMVWPIAKRSGQLADLTPAHYRGSCPARYPRQCPSSSTLVERVSNNDGPHPFVKIGAVGRVVGVGGVYLCVVQSMGWWVGGWVGAHLGGQVSHWM